MKKKGFTLAETLVTLAIVGVIAAISIPQVVTMAQKHQSEAMVAKIVYQTELGVQKMFSDYNSDPDNKSASQVDKILLVKHWNERLAKAINLTEKTGNVAWYNSIMAPAYALTDLNLRQLEGGSTSGSTSNSSITKNEDGTTTYHYDNSTGRVTYNYDSTCSSIGACSTCEYTSSLSVNVGRYGTTESESSGTRSGCLDLSSLRKDLGDIKGKPLDDLLRKDNKNNQDENNNNNNDDNNNNNNNNNGNNEPIADLPVPSTDTQIAGFDKTYNVFGLPAEVRLVVYNPYIVDKYDPNAEIMVVIIDTNGFDSKKSGVIGKDVFMYNLTNSGKMVSWNK